MEAGVRVEAIVAFVGISLGAAAAVAQRAPEPPAPPGRDSISRTPQTPSNAAADELTRRAARLGLDLDPKNSTAEHPAGADRGALASIGERAWMDAQLTSGDDSIAPEPQALRSFLESRSVSLWQVVEVLEAGTPKWPPRGSSEFSGRFIALLRLDRLLLSAAMAEERAGRPSEARRLLEASWSIFRSLAGDPDAVSAILATAVMKMQVGVLRKMREAPIEWLDRLSRDDPWRRSLEAFENEPRALAALDPSLAIDARSGSFSNVNVRAHQAAAQALRRVTPCGLASLSDADIVRPMVEEYRKWNDPGVDSGTTARLFSEMTLPELRKALVRSGRLAVDAELTLRILELRFARSASRDNQWPATLEDAASRVCPDAVYRYRSDGPSMEIAFQGSPPEAEYGLRLPLSFSTRSDRRPTPRPSPPAMTTPTPSPAPVQN